LGTVYRRQVRICTTCDRRLDTIAARRACEGAGHPIILRDQGPWWIKYQVDGRPQCVSSGSDKKKVAEDLLKEREGDVVKGLPLTAQVGKVRYEEAAEDLLNDYRTNARRSLVTLTHRLKHLQPFFGGRRLTGITTALVRTFVVKRQTTGASNAEINRELTALKRMFTLALQGGKLMARPHIPLLQEHNVRQGFFEPEQFASVRGHLPLHMRAIVEFANITGWRTPSEILPLEWRQVDLKAAEVRLDPGTTKNGEGRVFPFTTELRRILEEQQRVASHIAQEAGTIVRYVFCYTTGQKTGKRITDSGFNKAWRKASIAAGCPGRIPHDFRRTAVRNLVRASIPERVAMQLTGHKTRAVFERYNIVSPGDLRDAARRLDAFDRLSGGHGGGGRDCSQR
jgi:integrase